MRDWPRLLPFVCSAFLLLAATLAPGSAQAQEEPPGRAASAPSARVQGADPALLRIAARLRSSESERTAGVRIQLQPLDEVAERRREPSKTGPLRIGTVRPLPAGHDGPLDGAALRWSAAPGSGFTTAVEVRSPGAHSTQMSILFTALPERAEVRFYSPADADAAQGPFGAARLLETDWGGDEHPEADGRYPFWSPPVAGDRVVMEIWVAEPPRQGELVMSLGDMGHLWNDPVRPRRFEDIDSSQWCEVDVACWPNWINFLAEAVAKYTFTDGTYLYLCTGTVMNDRDPGSYRPFFLTAAHCVSTGAESQTMTLYWNFWRSSCGGAEPTELFTTSGARLHVTAGDISKKGSTDHTFLELWESPPGDYVLSGWDSSDATKTYKKKQVHTIHHPSGDLMMASKGKVKAFKSLKGRPDGSFSVSNKKPWSHLQVRWNRGVTEGGSSGSGLWAGTNADNSRLIGVLTGGASYCSTPKAPDVYGRFDEFYNTYEVVRQLLGGE